MKKLLFILLALPSYTNCNFDERSELSSVIVSAKVNKNGIEMRLCHDGEVKHTYLVKDFIMLSSKLDDVYITLLSKGDNVDLSTCHLALDINSYNSDTLLTDINELNLFLKKYLKIKGKISLNSESGRFLSNIILESSFPDPLRKSCIIRNSANWAVIDKTYSEGIPDSTLAQAKENEHSNLFSSTNFTMSDYCSFSFNKQLVDKVRKKDMEYNLFVCVFEKYRTNKCLFDRDDVFFEFEQYLDSEGFLQLRKHLLNLYSYNRKRTNRFE